jgi:hypothetical protein
LFRLQPGAGFWQNEPTAGAYLSKAKAGSAGNGLATINPCPECLVDRHWDRDFGRTNPPQPIALSAASRPITPRARRCSIRSSTAGLTDRLSVRSAKADVVLIGQIVVVEPKATYARRIGFAK